MTKDKLLWIAIGVLSAGLAVAAYPTLDQRVINPGDAAPSFSVVTENGKTITPANFGGRVLVLNFWATWCRPCLEEFGGLNKFAAETQSQGVVVLGVSVDRNEKAYKRFLESTRPSFLTSRDSEADIAASYGTFLFPETYIIGKDGKVLKKIIGPIEDWNDLRAAVNSL